VKRLKPLLIPFSKTILFSIIRIGLLYQYHFYVYVPIPCIGTIFLYLYWSPVSVPLSCNMILNNDIYCTYCLTCYTAMLTTWHLTYYYLTAAFCYDITYHLSPVMLTLDLWLSHLWESFTCYPVSYTVTCIPSTHVLLLYMYSCTLEFLNLSYSCSSCKLIIT